MKINGQNERKVKVKEETETDTLWDLLTSSAGEVGTSS